MINTRAVVSFAWVAGPPVATFLVGAFGDRSLLAALGAVGLLGAVVTALMTRAPDPVNFGPPAVADEPDAHLSRLTTGTVIGAFVALQAGNAAAVSMMTLFVTDSLGLDVMWAGAALAVAAVLEIPAMLVMGRLNRRHSSLGLIIGGCVAGIGYCAAMAALSGPTAVLAVQVLSAWLVAAVAGIGLALFQDMMPGPGVAAGSYANTRRIGAILGRGHHRHRLDDRAGLPDVFADSDFGDSLFYGQEDEEEEGGDDDHWLGIEPSGSTP